MEVKLKPDIDACPGSSSMDTKIIFVPISAILLLAAILVPAARAQGPRNLNGPTGIRHVLLVSIDGMHAVDYLNCSKGVNGGEPYCPNMAELGKTAVNYLDTSTSRTSYSFPGLMA